MPTPHQPMTDPAARKLAASPLARPKSRKLGEPEFARIPDNIWSGSESNRLLVALFFLAICLPSIAWLRGFESGEALDENRPLAPKPVLTFAGREKLPEQIDAYYRDYFGFRRRLIAWNKTVRYLWLGASSDDVIIGKQDWTFYAREGTIHDHLGLAQFSPTELVAWKQFLEARHSALAERGIKYVFAVAPDKPSIYPEMLPDDLRQSLRQTRFQQLMNYLRDEHSPVAVLDLRPALLSEKQNGRVYFLHDTHWNGRGFLAGSNAVLRYAQTLFPEVNEHQLGIEYKLEPRNWGGDELNLIAIPLTEPQPPTDVLFPMGEPKAKRVPYTLPKSLTPIPEPWLRPLKFVRPDATHSVLVVHDSFMRTGCEDRDHMVIAQSFHTSLFIGMKPSLAELLLIVDPEHPELVIEERVERSVIGLPPH